METLFPSIFIFFVIKKIHTTPFRYFPLFDKLSFFFL